MAKSSSAGTRARRKPEEEGKRGAANPHRRRCRRRPSSPFAAAGPLHPQPNTASSSSPPRLLRRDHDFFDTHVSPPPAATRRCHPSRVPICLVCMMSGGSPDNTNRGVQPTSCCAEGCGPWCVSGTERSPARDWLHPRARPRVNRSRCMKPLSLRETAEM